VDDAIAKRTIRAEMRSLRRSLPGGSERSARLWRHLTSVPEVEAAGVVMVFASIVGEPDTAPFIEWCQRLGKRIALPEDDPPVDPAVVDVVVVPGLAFTAGGDRLGQGGGWYDRFLPTIRPGTPTIGVAFHEQLVAALPLERHDVRVDIVVTDEGIARSDGPDHA
jgi:5-formyltetrahydrofolate cyclo-ligase